MELLTKVSLLLAVLGIWGEQVADIASSGSFHLPSWTSPAAQGLGSTGFESHKKRDRNSAYYAADQQTSSYYTDSQPDELKERTFDYFNTDSDYDYDYYGENEEFSSSGEEDRQDLLGAGLSFGVMLSAFFAALTGALVAPAIALGINRAMDVQLEWPEWPFKRVRHGYGYDDVDDRSDEESWLERAAFLLEAVTGGEPFKFPVFNRLSPQLQVVKAENNEEENMF